MLITDEIRKKAVDRIDDLLRVLEYYTADAGMILADRWDGNREGFEMSFNQGKQLMDDLGYDVDAFVADRVGEDGEEDE